MALERRYTISLVVARQETGTGISTFQSALSITLSIYHRSDTIPVQCITYGQISNHMGQIRNTQAMGAEP